MKPLGSDAVRHEFVEYFRRHGHSLISGASVLAKDDPTLLFVNSGMAPLKPYFTGDVQPPHRELTNVQPCIRTKDIDDVGDRHHLTFFEMLGSWSIGGYFKQRAIELAFDLLITVYNFTPEQLYVTVFEGDAALGLGPDDEAAAAWEAVGMPRDHIVPQPTADNFWGPAGDTGPCGPCTEVFLDTGDTYGPRWRSGAEFDTKRRYIEIWNAGVFMQFFKAVDGSLTPLPFTSVDTGSGLERVTMALNGLENVYETDLLLPVVRATQGLFGDSGEILRRHRVVADHVRASCMIMAEGVRPSNEGAGYIPRRLLRKCLTTAVQADLHDVDFGVVVNSVVERLGAHYPLLVSERVELHKAIDEECREFDGVLRRGLDRLESALDKKSALSGQDVFHLFATYGLPPEITRSLAAERGIQVDAADYQEEFRRHQELSRGGQSRGKDRRDVADLLVDVAPTTFDGYRATSGQGTVVALIRSGELVDSAGAGAELDIVLDRTVFYAEGGGQVGDRGMVRGSAGVAAVLDTQSEPSSRTLHRVRVIEGHLSVGDALELFVDEERRAATAANHSATHLLNAALRQVLGPHVRQAGSLVEPERLRFDFTHPQAVTREQLHEVERLVNTWILADHQRITDELPVQEAKSSGAISLEGENYGDVVRVVAFDGVSRELCGGTHVPHSSFIGSMRIRSEQSVAAGIRRITAVTRFGALQMAEEHADTLASVAATLRTNPRDLLATAQRLVSVSGKRAAPGAVSGESGLAQSIETTTAADVDILAGRLDADAAALRASAVEISSRRDRVVLLWSDEGGKARVVVAVPERYRGRASAAALVKAVLGPVGGAGGGSAAVAQGGGGIFADSTGPAQALVGLLS